MRQPRAHTEVTAAIRRAQPVSRFSNKCLRNSFSHLYMLTCIQLFLNSIFVEGKTVLLSAYTDYYPSKQLCWAMHIKLNKI